LKLERHLLTLYQLLQLQGLSVEKLRLLRHSNTEIPILKTYSSDIDKFNCYQSFQNPNAFRDSNLIAVFAPLTGYEALFLGTWRVKEYFEKLTDQHKGLIDQYDFPQEWKSKSAWYGLEKETASIEFAERVVIDWGKNRNWQSTSDKNIIEIKRALSIDEFSSYSDMALSLEEIKKIVNNQRSNQTWVNALQSVMGIYLIKDRSDGKLYVGSAYGMGGVFQRWADYAQSGHGGNKDLMKRLPQDFEFSILEIINPRASAPEVIALENKWKDRLGTRENGNLNRLEI